MVKVALALAVIVALPPRATEVPLIVTLELAKNEFGNVAPTLVMVTFAKVKFPTEVVVPPSVTVAFPIVAELLARKELGKVVPTDVIVTFANVILPIEVVVFPK